MSPDSFAAPATSAIDMIKTRHLRGGGNAAPDLWRICAWNSAVSSNQRPPSMQGLCGTVGVAGLIQSGGFGSFSKRFGSAAGRLVEAEVVTADGEIRIANACSNPDLFWALKGGGGGHLARSLRKHCQFPRRIPHDIEAGHYRFSRSPPLESGRTWKTSRGYRSDDRVDADAGQCGQVLHGCESVWLPAALLEPPNIERFADALFACAKHWQVSLHVNKGLPGHRGRPSMQPEIPPRIRLSSEPCAR
jgi:hypothetical protein